MTNPWLTHLKKYHSAHPELSYGEAMKKAKATYKKTKKASGLRRKKKVAKRR